MESIAEWIAIGLITIGMLTSWWRNNRAKSEEYGALKKDIEVINSKLDNDEHGLDAIHKQVSSFRAHCADLSGRLDERVRENARRLERLEKKANRKKA